MGNGGLPRFSISSLQSGGDRNSEDQHIHVELEDDAVAGFLQSMPVPSLPPSRLETCRDLRQLVALLEECMGPLHIDTGEVTPSAIKEVCEQRVATSFQQLRKQALEISPSGQLSELCARFHEDALLQNTFLAALMVDWSQSTGQLSAAEPFVDAMDPLAPLPTDMRTYIEQSMAEGTNALASPEFLRKLFTRVGVPPERLSVIFQHLFMRNESYFDISYCAQHLQALWLGDLYIWAQQPQVTARDPKGVISELLVIQANVLLLSQCLQWLRTPEYPGVKRQVVLAPLQILKPSLASRLDVLVDAKSPDDIVAAVRESAPAELLAALLQDTKDGLDSEAEVSQLACYGSAAFKKAASTVTGGLPAMFARFLLARDQVRWLFVLAKAVENGAPADQLSLNGGWLMAPDEQGATTGEVLPTPSTAPLNGGAS